MMLSLSKYAKGLVAGLGGAATIALAYADQLCNDWVPAVVGLLTALGVTVVPNRGYLERSDTGAH